ncbi:hypothetical protein E8E13_010525 [Curvularia kusanoi]|uniref:Pre-mRNA-processing factor 39 n=1 Tax=Curvularia kusanoi TaxID=90978 RepID=A0A9P4TGY0_CURKU|nr:hypothetical protein E8E13_010525 [Curvularia kusanoi]
MLPVGRGAIAEIKYTGDEAAPEIEKLLAAVVEKEDEFDRWEALVARASDLEGGVTRNSSPSAIELVRNVYDAFLQKFPLFFGYWKKYADLEFAIGGTETADMVYERGVSAVTTSVDLWANYCDHKTKTCHDNEIVRELFERGAHFVGLDFQSHPFWDKYIEFEERAHESGNVVALCSRVFRLPIYQFSRYYEKFRTYIATLPAEQLVDEETLGRLKLAVEAQNQGQPQKAPQELERDLLALINQDYFDKYTTTQQAVQERWNYEQAIKRAYFHVTELEEDELDNWRKYLDYEEKQGDFERTCFLYERCLVACALYEEFWFRYARWMFSQGKDENTRLIYMRASCIFVPIEYPQIRLNWARFEEKLGQISNARDIHEAILMQAPDLVGVIKSLAGLVRRHEGPDAAVKVLEEYIQERNSHVAGILVAEQARILLRCKNAPEEARQAYKDKEEKCSDSKDFWYSYLEFETNEPTPDQEDAQKRVKAVFQQVHRKGRLSPDELKTLSSFYMNFLLDRGGEDAAEEYMQLDQMESGYASKDYELALSKLDLQQRHELALDQQKIDNLPKRQ